MLKDVLWFGHSILSSVSLLLETRDTRHVVKTSKGPIKLDIYFACSTHDKIPMHMMSALHVIPYLWQVLSHPTAVALHQSFMLFDV